MTTTTRKPLRLWPGIALASVMVAAAMLLLLFTDDTFIFGAPATVIAFFGSVVSGLLILIWWFLFSRAPWQERVIALVMLPISMALLRPLAHPSLPGAAMGFFFYIISIPVMAFAIVAVAAAMRNRPGSTRRMALAAAMFAACAAWTLVRTDGVSGGGDWVMHWRWTPTPEQKLLAQADDLAAAPAPAQAPALQAPAQPAALPVASAPAPVAPAAKPAEAAAPVTRVTWTGFRGGDRDSIVRGVRLETDWAKTPPVEMWRRAVGPGWSSFAVNDGVFYTQEQRGEEEVVGCYRVATGEPVWRHRDPVRFYESNAGAGPRSTPTLHDGRVYTVGATGIVNVLDAATGTRIWSRDMSADTGRKVPQWGFSSSPVIVDDMVVAAAAGQLIAYDRASGTPRWTGTNGAGGYSSPQLATIDGVEQILFLAGQGAMSLAPKDGSVLWQHAWQGVPIVQPSVLPDGDVIVTTADAMGGLGVRRLTAKRSGAAWTVEERWTSRGLKPYFNDYVIHKGHAYGFDGNILSAVDLSSGERKWKGGRFGHGQLVLLADQDLLLLLSEDGEIGLVSATPDKFTEHARIPALNSKTWNHPVVAGDVLLIRNGEEMAAYKLPTARAQHP